MASSIKLPLHQQVNTIFHTLRRERSDLSFEVTEGYLIKRSFLKIIIIIIGSFLKVLLKKKSFVFAENG